MLLSSINTDNGSDRRRDDRFEWIYHTYRTQMLSTAYAVLHNTTDAEDAVQDAFVAIARNMEKLSDMEPPAIRVYVCKCAKSAALNMLPGKRRRDGTVSLEEHGDTATDDMVAAYITRERYEEIVAAIRALPEIYRDVLTLHYVYEMKPKEIAVSLGRRAETVKSQIKRGRALLISALKEGENL